MSKICWRTELAILTIVFCVTAPLFTGQTYFWNDAMNLGLPYGSAIKTALQKGEPLWWSPDIYAGYCSLGAGQSGWNYPLYRLLYYLLPVAVAYSAAHIIHFWLLARGVLGFCRELGMPVLASLVASSVALMGGAVAAHTTHSNIIAGMGWTGILLWLTARVLRRDNWIRDALLLSAALGLMITVSHPQYTFFAVLSILVMTPWLRESRIGIKCVSKRYILVFTMGIALSLVQLLPVIQYSYLNSRIRVTAEERAMSRFDYITQESLSRTSLVRFIQPDYFGSVYNKSWKAEDWRYWEAKGFSGTSLLLLAISSAISTILFWRKTSNPLAKSGLVLAVLALFLMLGQHNPVWRILADIPPFSLFRIPMRYVWLLQLAIGFLAAVSVLEIEKNRPRKITRWLVVAFAMVPIIILVATIVRPHFPTGLKIQSVVAVSATALVLLSMFARRDNIRRQTLRAGFLLAVLEMTISWYGFVHSKPNAEIMERPPLVQKMHTAPAARLFTVNIDSDVKDEATLHYLHVNSGILWGVNYFDGYDTLIPHQQSIILNKLKMSFLKSKSRDMAGEFKRLCDTYSIRWVLAPLSNPIISGFKEIGRDGPYRLIENPDARPVAYAIPTSQTIDNNQSAARPRIAPDILPVTVKYQGLVRWEITTQSNQPTLVVLTQSLYPGWHVTVDNREAVMSESDDLYMAVRVPAGNHSVAFHFDNQWIWGGIRLSQIAAVIWVCLFCWASYWRKDDVPRS